MGIWFENERSVRMFGNIIISMGIWLLISTKRNRVEKKSKELQMLTPDDILDDCRNNFEIPYSMLKKIEISKSKEKPLMKILKDEKWKKIGNIDKNESPDYLDTIRSALPGIEVEIK